uniref:Fatty acid binding protein 6 n=1 Tax=Catharus ustulatus TaxID=91951 RepID=A0A8C3UR52_CATUS
MDTSTGAKLNCSCCSSSQAHPKGTMAFTGKYEFEADENYDAFVQKIGLSSEKVEMGRNCKIVTEVVQNGNDFTWTQHFPGGRTTTNSFTVGSEADMETFGGKKFKVSSGSSSAPQPRVDLDLEWEANPVKVSFMAGGGT